MARLKKAGWQAQKHTLNQRRDAVQEIMNLYMNEDSVTLCRSMADIRHEQALLEVEQQEFSERLEAIGQVLADRWQAEGLSSMNVDGVGTFSLYPRLYVSAADKDLYFTWLRENGMEGLIQPAVASKTTESLVRERLEEGQPCDAMGLNITYKTTVK